MTRPAAPAAHPKNEPDELVWVVPAQEINEDLFGSTKCQTLKPSVYWRAAAGNQQLWPPLPHGLPCMGELFMARSAAEENLDFYQPIPYVVMVQRGHYVRFRRLSKSACEQGGGEIRLAGRTSIGAGGHLSSRAWPKKDLGVELRLWDEIWRELEEEFVFETEPGPPSLWRKGSDVEFQGYLLDLRDRVGSVHLGLVYTLSLSDHVHIAIHPDERHKLAMEPALAPGELDSELEGWSQLIAAHSLAMSPSAVDAP